MQHPAGARSPDLGMARQVSDATLVDARVMDPLAPASGGPGLRRPRPPAAPAVPAIPAPAGVGRASADVVRASFWPDTRGRTGKPIVAPVWGVRDVPGGRTERGSGTIHGRAIFKIPALAPYQSSGGCLAKTEPRAG